MFEIRMGIPEMLDFWNDLLGKKKRGEICKGEEELLRRLYKAIKLLQANPKHPGLKTHEIKELSKKYEMKIWQSYIDQGQLARRLYWAYGPNRKQITILGLEPHPEDGKRGSYERINLSDFPD